ncbi:hypothetical protein [Yinghuangia sp. YIM S09857]|uniref:hypothetical protein n=1 Tax=Yinghuangia sp. YIM S09857 TaxID=3436929 RepID=UPI003F538B28
MHTVTRTGPGVRGGRTAVAGVMLALAVALAGCGSSGHDDKVASADNPSASASNSPSGAAKDGSEPGDALAESLRYAQCMRENGVPQFPDPVQKGNGGLDISVPEGVDRQAVDAAEKVCKKFLPNAGENKPVDPEIAKRNRELAKCMRENGVPNFPDPGPDGGLQIQNDPGSGLDPSNPAFDAASKKCNMLPPGGEGGVNDVKTP